MLSKTSLFIWFAPFSTAFAHAPTFYTSLPSVLHTSRSSDFFFSDYTCPFPPEPYVVKPSHGKGLGVFASHTLEIGSIIMRESPILKISRPGFIKGSGYPISEVTEMVRREFERLSLSEQREIIELTYHALPGEVEKQGGDVLGFVFRTNAYNTGSEFGIFPKIARINHSCRPNAAYYWNEKLNRRVIYATRKILDREEIFVSYIPLLMSREERQKRLDRYGFSCKCSACAQPTANISLSNQRRTDINLALKAFEPQLTLSIPSHSSALRKARKNAESSLQLVELLEQEGLAEYYAMAYRIVAISHARVEDWETATVWANKGYELRVMEDSGSVFTMEMHTLTSSFIESWKSQLENRTRLQSKG